MTSNLLIRYHQVLSTVAGADNGISAAAIAERVGLPRSTAHRLALALCEVGYLQQQESSSFALGPALDDILIPRLFNAQRPHTILPVLLNLANELQETSFLARRHCGRIEIIDALPVPGTHQSYIYPGLGDRPLDKCSSSKAILAFCDKQDVEAWLATAREESELPASEYPADTFWAELVGVRDTGYAICDGEIDDGVISIASPVFVEPFGAIYSIGVTGPTVRIKAQPIEEIASRVRAAAKSAASRLVSHAANMSPKSR